MSNKQKRQSPHRPPAASRPLVTVCMIVKDEEDNMDRCLSSVRPVADEIVVVDTGSQDRTVAIARRHGAKIYQFKWCDDFAAARNVALAHATGRWVLQLDADEQLAPEGASHLRQIVSFAPTHCWGFYIPVRSHVMRDGCEMHTVVNRLLLFRNHPDFRYFSRIHEYLRYTGDGPNPDFEYLDSLPIEHYGYMPDLMERKRKGERNLRLLRLSAIEELGDPYLQFNLGLQYYCMERFEEAIEPFQRATKTCPSPSANYLPGAYAMLVVALSRSGRGVEAPALIEEAEQRLPILTPDFYCNAAEAFKTIGHLEKALTYFQRAIDAPEVRISAESDPATHTWLPRLGIGVVHEMRGEFDRAGAAYEDALTYSPQHTVTISRLAATALKLGEMERSLGYVQRALRAGTMPESVCWDLLQVCEELAEGVKAGQAHLPELARVGGELALRVPIKPDLGAKLAGACLRFGQPERGVAAATATLDQKEDVLARTNRGLCYFALGRYEEASEDIRAAAESQSRRERPAFGMDGDRQPSGPPASDGRLKAEPGRVAVPEYSARTLTLDAVCRELRRQQASYDWLRNAGLGKKTSLPSGGASSPARAPLLASIIIPASDEIADLQRCLQAIVDSTPEELYEVVIVDNASTDGTGEFLKLLSGDVTVITNETDAGFAVACEQGARAAKGKLLVFLHCDVVPGEGWLENLVAAMESGPSIGAFGPREVSQAHRGNTDHENGTPETVLFPLPSSFYRKEEKARSTRLFEVKATRPSCGSDDLRTTHDITVELREEHLAAENHAKGSPRDLSAPPAGAAHGQQTAAPTARPGAASSYYAWSRPDVQALVPEHAKRILDIGCAAGALGRALKLRQACEVTGVEIVPEVAENARGVLDRVYVGDIAGIAPALPEQTFDCIIMSDVLEHLVDPTAVLSALTRSLAPDGRIVLSVPNVRHWSVVRGLLEGRWDYADAGLLDRTHLRFFTRSSIEELLASAGLRPVLIRDTAIQSEPVPAPVLEGLQSAGLDVRTLAEESQVYQFLYAAELAGAPAATPLTSIVILTHNQLAHTRLCLSSVESHTPEPHEIIVVDNASTDGTLEYLRSWMAGRDNVRIIANATNRGFAAGNNQGLAVARGDYLLLLNNDTIVTEGWLGRMLALFQQFPRVGIAGPMSNCAAGPQLLPDASYSSIAEMESYACDWAKEHAGQSMPIMRVVGFCLLARRAVIEQIGGLDERFGTGNFEDDDFCVRAAMAGFEARIARDAFVHHAGGQTFKGAKIDYRQSLLGNWEVFKAKWGIPLDSPIERGYRISAQPQHKALLYVALP